MTKHFLPGRIIRIDGAEQQQSNISNYKEYNNDNHFNYFKSSPQALLCIASMNQKMTQLGA